MTDQSTIRLVIGTLALLALVVVCGGIYLTAIDRSLPGELIAIGAASAGAVAGILSRTTSGEPQEVIGPAGGPLPVKEGGHADTSLITCIACVWVAVILTFWAFESGPFS